MATNLHIDDKLLARAVRAGHHRTKREAVNQALEDYVRRSDQVKWFRKLAGTIDYDPIYDPKQGRRKR